MKKSSLFFIIFTLLLCSVVFAQKQDKVKLEYDFKVGDYRNYQLKVDGKVEVAVKPAVGKELPKNTANMQGAFTYIQEVKEVDGLSKTAKISVTYSNASMNTIIGGQVIPNADVSSLAGKVAVLTVADDGQVKTYEVPEGLSLSMQNADFSRQFVEFPKHELRIGESWFRQDESANDESENFSSKHTTSSKYTFLEIVKKGNYDCAKVSLESQTNSYTKSKKSKLVLNGVVKGEVSGIIYYDLASGYVVYSDLRTSLNNKIVTKSTTEKGIAETETGAITTILETELRTVTELL
ncbi:MAG: hypothetical protein ABII88_03820 [Candidatus Omnitrophota bacterium]